MNRTISKITEQHSIPSPGWSVPSDMTPRKWIEQAVKPLLTGMPVRVEAIQEYSGSRREQPVPPEKAVKGICDIQISERSSYVHFSDRISCTLYWVGTTRHVALSPTQVGGGYFYNQPPDLRYLADSEALVKLVKTLQDQAQQAAFQEQKRGKIKAIKRQAIVAQLRQIAAEERFAFYVETSALLIRVGIRMDDSNQLEIIIPFSEFENILPQVREAVIKLRALHQHKIRFKTIQITRHKDWITPDPVPSP